MKTKNELSLLSVDELNSLKISTTSDIKIQYEKTALVFNEIIAECGIFIRKQLALPETSKVRLDSTLKTLFIDFDVNTHIELTLRSNDWLSDDFTFLEISTRQYSSTQSNNLNALMYFVILGDLCKNISTQPDLMLNFMVGNYNAMKTARVELNRLSKQLEDIKSVINQINDDLINQEVKILIEKILGGSKIFDFKYIKYDGFDTVRFIKETPQKYQIQCGSIMEGGQIIMAMDKSLKKTDFDKDFFNHVKREVIAKKLFSGLFEKNKFTVVYCFNRFGYDFNTADIITVEITEMNNVMLSNSKGEKITITPLHDFYRIMLMERKNIIVE